MSPPAHTKALMARTLQQMLLLCSEICLIWMTLQKPVSPLPLCVSHGLALEGCLQKAALGKALGGLGASRVRLRTRRERLKVCERLHKESSTHHPALMAPSCPMGMAVLQVVLTAAWEQPFLLQQGSLCFFGSILNCSCHGACVQQGALKSHHALYCPSINLKYMQPHIKYYLTHNIHAV